MSKRIALICKGKSDPNTGKDCSVSKLKSLTNNVNRVASVLSEHGNWVPHIYEVTTTTKLKEKINDIKENGVDEFLFYYTGHGRASSKSFEIVGVDECDIDLVTILEQTRIGNRAVSIVLDACESKAMADNWSNLIPYEILTATDDKAYEVENIAGDGKWYSYFSHNFCEYMKNTEYHTTLSKFNKYLISQYDSIDDKKKQESNYRLPTINRYTKINMIVYGKQFQTIRKELKAKYATLNDLKKSILSYISRGLSFYETIFNENNMDELINLLIQKESSGYLYCLLKSKGLLPAYTDSFEGDRCCKTYKHQVQKIMVVVNYDKFDNLYDIGFYVDFDDNEAQHVKWIREKNWNDFLLETLIEKLEYFTQTVIKQNIELVFVLPYDKVESDFHDLEIKTGLDEDDKESLSELFNISYKLFSRLESYYLDNQWITHWKENLEAFNEAKEIDYKTKLCLLKPSESIACFVTKNSGQNSFLLANRYLCSLGELKMIYKRGVPFMATSVSNHSTFNKKLKKHWKKKETKVKEFKEHTFEYLKPLNDVYFLYDDGYDEAFLSSYIEQSKKTNEEENKFLGMDYE